MVTEFESKIYDKLKQVLKGKICTYAELARAVNKPKSAWVVGNAINKKEALDYLKKNL